MRRSGVRFSEAAPRSRRSDSRELDDAERFRECGQGELLELVDDRTAVPAALSEVITPGRTLTRRAADVLAYFDRPGTSNGPTEAINGRLEHLRGSALGVRNLTNYVARSLLEAGGFRPHLHPRSG